MPDCFANKVLREGICFYKALTVARKYLWLSWPTAAHAEDTAPASAALVPVLTLLAVPPYAPDAVQLAATPAAALDMLGILSQQPGQERTGAAVRAVLDADPQAAPGYEAVRRAADTAGACLLYTSSYKVPFRCAECFFQCTTAAAGLQRKAVAPAGRCAPEPGKCPAC